MILVLRIQKISSLTVLLIIISRNLFFLRSHVGLQFMLSAYRYFVALGLFHSILFSVRILYLVRVLYPVRKSGSAVRGHPFIHRDYFMENAWYDFYSLAVSYQKTHSFAALTRSFSDTTQLVTKNRTKHFPCCSVFIS